jgi:hypothetical protein
VGWAFPIPLPRDAIAKVGDADRFDYAGAFEVEPAMLEVRKETNSVAEQDRNELDVDLVEEASVQVLLGHVGGADGNVLFVG